MQHINASIVLYNSPRDYLKKSIHSLLNTDLKVKLYLIDNSINSNLDDIVHIDDNRIEYILMMLTLAMVKLII